MILNGKELSEERLTLLKEEISKSGIVPHLATVLVGTDPASQLYVRMKHKACEKVGIISVNVSLPESISTKELLDELDKLNNNPEIDGILVQLPLPKQVDTHAVIAAIDPLKDADGFHPSNMGLLAGGMPGIRPCTPKGIMTILEKYNISLAGKRAVVIGRSVDVGRPVALLLLNADATVTICHSKTVDLASITKQADIIVAAAGKAHMVTADMVKQGAVVIDVGTNRVDGKLLGDVDFDNVSKVASALTPVPGGVGPMTIATLMENTFSIAKCRCKPVE